MAFKRECDICGTTMHPSDPKAGEGELVVYTPASGGLDSLASLMGATPRLSRECKLHLCEECIKQLVASVTAMRHWQATVVAQPTMTVAKKDHNENIPHSNGRPAAMPPESVSGVSRRASRKRPGTDRA